MDEHEYLEKFRLAILWDEMGRRRFVRIARDLDDFRSPAARRRKDKQRNRQYKRQLPFDWWNLFAPMGSIRDDAFYFLREGRIPNLTEFRLNILRLQTQMKRVRNKAVRDYCDHFMFVAEETLRVLDSSK